MEYHSDGIPTATDALMSDLEKPALGRREWHRVAIDMPAVLSSGRKRFAGRLVDISVGGALFAPERERLRFPGPCLLRLPIAAPSADHTIIRAIVVRAGAGRFGLRWTQRIPAHALIKLALPLER
jgi:hypothetical protein